MTIKDTLSREKLLAESINSLTNKDITIKKEGRKYFNKDFIFIGDLLNLGNLRLFI